MPRFSKSARVLGADEFAEVKRKGRRARVGCLTVATLSTPHTRLGLTVSRHVGMAVARNRIKRVVREFFRLHRDVFPRGDNVVIPAKGAAELSNETIRLQLLKALKKLTA
jgi:ribonuclease P protein component